MIRQPFALGFFIEAPWQAALPNSVGKSGNGGQFELSSVLMPGLNRWNGATTTLPRVFLKRVQFDEQSCFVKGAKIMRILITYHFQQTVDIDYTYSDTTCFNNMLIL